MRKRYGKRDKITSDCHLSPSRTQQAFKSIAEINNIVTRYHQSGVLATDPQNTPVRHIDFVDCYNQPDLLVAARSVARARQGFDQLPATERAKFANRVEVFIDWLSDSENRLEAIAAGYLPEGDQEVKAREDANRKADLAALAEALRPPVEVSTGDGHTDT